MFAWKYEVEFPKRLFRPKEDNASGTVDANDHFEASIKIKNRYFPKRVEIVSLSR